MVHPLLFFTGCEYCLLYSFFNHVAHVIILVLTSYNTNNLQSGKFFHALICSSSLGKENVRSVNDWPDRRLQHQRSAY